MLHAYAERRADDEDVVQVEDCSDPLCSQNCLWVNSRIRLELQPNKGHQISLIRQECLTAERDIQIKSAREEGSLRKGASMPTNLLIQKLMFPPGRPPACLRETKSIME
jgi:hypothetical protein